MANGNGYSKLGLTRETIKVLNIRSKVRTGLPANGIQPTETVKRTHDCGSDLTSACTVTVDGCPTAHTAFGQCTSGAGNIGMY